MNNEPVAWITMSGLSYQQTGLSDRPLYTHPVDEKQSTFKPNNQVKELTDEEIMDELVKVKHTWVATTNVWFEFEKEELKKAIRAILRKAQEK